MARARTGALLAVPALIPLSPSAAPAGGETLTVDPLAAATPVL